MNINAPVAVSDLKFNRKCQILPLKPAINCPVLAAKPNPSQKSSQRRPSCSRDRDGMSLTTRTNLKSPLTNRRTKGNRLKPVRLNPKPTARPVPPPLIMDLAQQPQHPHPRHLRLGLRDPVRLQQQGHLPVPLLPPDPGLPLRPAANPNISRRYTGRGTCVIIRKAIEIISPAEPGQCFPSEHKDHQEFDPYL